MGSATLLGAPTERLPTPALVIDLDRFEANLARMADWCRSRGVSLRPHAKTHKCPEVARRQVASGAIGIGVATVAEAEAMVDAGLPGVLLTSPIVDRDKVGRMVDLATGGGKILLAVGDPLEADLLQEMAASARVTLDVLLDLDVGDRRIGARPGPGARVLAGKLSRSPALRLVGIQAYSGIASHVAGFDERQSRSREALAPAVVLVRELERDGLRMEFLSVGSTGTYNIDAEIDGVTELQSGSYIFMDNDYRRIGSAGGGADYGDFRPSLSVLATVVAASHDDLVTVDAGIKAFATDVDIAPGVVGHPGLAYRRRGDEFGQLTAAPGTPLPAIGTRLEFSVPHCDPTVNLYDRFYAVRGGTVEAIWPIVARREFRSVER